MSMGGDGLVRRDRGRDLRFLEEQAIRIRRECFGSDCVWCRIGLLERGRHSKPRALIRRVWDTEPEVGYGEIGNVEPVTCRAVNLYGWLSNSKGEEPAKMHSNRIQTRTCARDRIRP